MQLKIGSIMSKNILITGGTGYVGQSLFNYLKHDNKITLLTRKELDLTNPIETNSWFKDKYFDCVLHTAITGGNRTVLDTSHTLDNNILLYYNLLHNQDHFTRFINFGSGAELYSNDAPYGLSKFTIYKSILEKPNFFNIRIFAVFDENENSRRFIKSNILRYINQESLLIHKNKQMDFFYMSDLCELVKFYIKADNPPKEIDCTYSYSPTLLDIANIINDLDSYTCNIDILDNTGLDTSYTGYPNTLLNYFGLYSGIKEMYTKLKC